MVFGGNRQGCKVLIPAQFYRDIQAGLRIANRNSLTKAGLVHGLVKNHCKDLVKSNIRNGINKPRPNIIEIKFNHGRSTGGKAPLIICAEQGPGIILETAVHSHLVIGAALQTLFWVKDVYR